jgi:hypothetical protein
MGWRSYRCCQRKGTASITMSAGMRDTNHATTRALYRDLWRYAALALGWLVVLAIAGFIVLGALGF